MNTAENFKMITDQFISIIYSPFNRILILCCSAQIFSMIIKMLIKAVKYKKLNASTMVNYGGMPSSHTVFISAFMFGIFFDKNYGMMHPLFTLSIIVTSLTCIDSIRFRGTVDRLNEVISGLIKENNLKTNDKIPKKIAHTTPEVIGGIIFAFLYTIIFYTFFYHLFN